MKIICVGRNYAEHAKELGNEVPEEPVIFMKPKNALSNSKAPFYYPAFTNELHYECELVLRVCKNGRYIPKNKAREYFDAITLGIDFTARDVQDECKKKGLPWEKAKAFDNSAYVGDFKLLAKEEMPADINFSFKKNGSIVQQGNSNNMIFDFYTLISSISQYFSLNIGDLIFTGTPAGVGESLVGDEFEAFYENESIFKLKIR